LRLFINAKNPDNRFFQVFYGYTNQPGVEEDFNASSLVYTNSTQESIYVEAITLKQLPITYRIITATIEHLAVIFNPTLKNKCCLYL